jgi:hypothetical protein
MQLVRVIVMLIASNSKIHKYIDVSLFPCSVYSFTIILMDQEHIFIICEMSCCGYQELEYLVCPL